MKLSTSIYVLSYSKAKGHDYRKGHIALRGVEEEAGCAEQWVLWEAKAPLCALLRLVVLENIVSGIGDERGVVSKKPRCCGIGFSVTAY